MMPRSRSFAEQPSAPETPKKERAPHLKLVAPAPKESAAHSKPDDPIFILDLRKRIHGPESKIDLKRKKIQEAKRNIERIQEAVMEKFNFTPEQYVDEMGGWRKKIQHFLSGKNKDYRETNLLVAEYEAWQKKLARYEEELKNEKVNVRERLVQVKARSEAHTLTPVEETFFDEGEKISHEHDEMRREAEQEAATMEMERTAKRAKPQKKKSRWELAEENFLNTKSVSGELEDNPTEQGFFAKGEQMDQETEALEDTARLMREIQEEAVREKKEEKEKKKRKKVPSTTEEITSILSSKPSKRTASNTPDRTDKKNAA
jgi:hypothetical protein